MKPAHLRPKIRLILSLALLTLFTNFNITYASTLFQLTKSQVSSENQYWAGVDESHFNGNRGFIWQSDGISGSFDQVCLYLGNASATTTLTNGSVTIYSRTGWPTGGPNTFVASSDSLNVSVPLVSSLYDQTGFRHTCFKFSSPINVSGSDYYAFAVDLQGLATALQGSVNSYPDFDVVSSNSISSTGSWVGSAPPLSLLSGQSFFAHIKSTNTGTRNLYSATSTSSSIIKKIPEDWIVKVASTTDSSGNVIYADGYLWNRVIDLTDNVEGWVQAEDASSTTQYLEFSDNQMGAASTASSYIATTSRPDVILDAIDHYYNNTDTEYSLYSSDDGSNNISTLKDESFEEKVIWGIAAQETGPFGFNNEVVSFDYGHGIMQLTFNAWSHEPGDLDGTTWDNRGIGSRLEIIPCAAIGTDDYVNCYTNAGIADTGVKYYKPYAGNSNNPTYKQYVNTEQSIYANIKDGMRVLQDKYSGINITTSTTVNGTVYSANEREIIQVTERYNGACGYVDDVADKLDDIDTYFPTATTSDITSLIQKMHTAGDEMICAQLHSPADISIHDSRAKIVGVVNDQGENDYEMAVYDRGEKFAKIFFPGEETYRYKVVGTGNGTYGLDITLKKGDHRIVFTAERIPVKSDEIHIYQVNKEMLEKGEKGVDIQVDSDGDGIIDRTLTAGLKLDSREFEREEVIPEQDQPALPDVVNEEVVLPVPELEVGTSTDLFPLPVDQSTTTPVILEVSPVGDEQALTI